MLAQHGMVAGLSNSQTELKKWKSRARSFSIVLALVVVAAYITYDRPRQRVPEAARIPNDLSNMKPTTKPHVPANAPRSEPEARAQEPSPTSLLTRLTRDGIAPPDVTLAQVEPYLRANGRSAGSLLAAFYVTGDQGLLREAMEKYPKDPKVCFVGYLTGPYKDREPVAADQRQWLEAFKQSTPENPLGSYLVARECFKSGQTDQAVQELQASANKPKLGDFAADFIQNADAIWRAAGYSEAEAKVFASVLLPTRYLTELRSLGQNLVELANGYRQAGDQTSAQAALQVALTMGQQLDQPSNSGFMRNVVGLEIQKQALGAMDPSGPYDEAGKTVQDRLEEIGRRRASLVSMAQQWLTAADNGTPSEEDFVNFFEPQRTVGSEEALRWWANKPASDR